MRNLCRLLFIALLGGLLFSCATPDIKDTGGAKVLSSKELIKWAKAGEEYLLLDVRTPSDYDEGHIPGAKNLPYIEIARSIPQLREWSDGRVVVYDETGKRSALVANKLIRDGFQNVYVLKGHLKEWRSDRLPLQ
jgi:rhodanese-related sulfurtransferase